MLANLALTGDHICEKKNKTFNISFMRTKSMLVIGGHLGRVKVWKQGIHVSLKSLESPRLPPILSRDRSMPKDIWHSLGLCLVLDGVCLWKMR